MGYTHYWKIDSEITPEKFRSLQSIAARIVCESEASVEFSMNTNQHPDHADICLNGIGENAHETFLLTPHKAKFECCKTNRKPYDEIVVGILLVATGRGLLEFTSDGSGDELSAGWQLKHKVLYEKALAKKKLFDRKVAQEKQMEAQGTGDEFLDASPTVKAALTSVLAKAEEEECLTCEEKVMDGGTWGYCDECWQICLDEQELAKQLEKDLGDDS